VLSETVLNQWQFNMFLKIYERNFLDIQIMQKKYKNAHTKFFPSDKPNCNF